MEDENGLELSLTRNGKVLFRMDVGALDVDAVMRLTETAIIGARPLQQTIQPVVINAPKELISRPVKARRKSPKRSKGTSKRIYPSKSEKGVSPKMLAVLYSVYVKGGNATNTNLKEIVEIAKTIPSFEAGRDPIQAVRFQFRQMKKSGLLEETSFGKKLTEKGLEIAQKVALEFESKSSNMITLFKPSM
jgi:hypothetical protein